MPQDQFTDRNMTCTDCRNPFVWTAGEQAFFKQKNLTSEPKRCPPCRQARKQRQNAQSDSRFNR